MNFHPPLGRVLVLQHVAAEGPGAIGAALAARGMELRTVRIDLGQPVPRDAGGAAGLVVMGGPRGVYEAGRFPHLADELRLIESFLKSGLPILGICLGSQLLAAALGARVRPSGFKEIGWHPVRLRDAAGGDPLWSGLPETFTAFHWHGDTFDLPAGAVRLASSELTENQAFHWGPSAYGLLFHLEVDAEQVRGMASAFAEEVSAAGLSPEPILRGAELFMEPLQRLGREVFDRWARIANP